MAATRFSSASMRCVFVAMVDAPVIVET
jgi:hypothetical protein